LEIFVGKKVGKEGKKEFVVLFSKMSFFFFFNYYCGDAGLKSEYNGMRGVIDRAIS
jgi:hypothetical protein